MLCRNKAKVFDALFKFINKSNLKLYQPYHTTMLFIPGVLSFNPSSVLFILKSPSYVPGCEKMWPMWTQPKKSIDTNGSKSAKKKFFISSLLNKKVSYVKKRKCLKFNTSFKLFRWLMIILTSIWIGAPLEIYVKISNSFKQLNSKNQI